MTDVREWEHWEGRWQSASPDRADAESLIRRMRRVRRAMVWSRALSAAVALFALFLIAAALQHAGNPFERTLGFVVAVGIAAAWLVDRSDRRHAHDDVESPPERYAAARRALLQRRLRFAWFAWIVTALDVIFLIPWWIGGFAVHGFGFHWMQILSVWLPVAVIIVFAGWVAAVRSRAKRELDSM
jgi:hypothetical protein